MSAQMKLIILLVSAALAVFGCGDSGGGGGDGAGGAGGGAGGAGGGAGGMGGDGGAGGGMEQGLTARSPGRMTIEQLARSIPIVTGGLRWTEDFGQGPTDMLEVLAPTLGVPDYFLVVEENLEPSLIIAKFMQDASRRICTRWVERDRDLPVADRTLVRHDDWESLEEADVRLTLRALQMRFFGHQVAEGTEDERQEALVELFTNASSTAPEGEAAYDGWLSVCIALMSDPEFVIY